MSVVPLASAEDAKPPEAPKTAGSEVPAPERVKFVLPTFPPDALAHGIPALVVIELVIDDLVARREISKYITACRVCPRAVHRRAIGAHDHDFGARLLYPADDRVRWTDGEPNMAEYFIAQSGRSQALLQYGKAFPVFGQQGYSNPMHGAALADFSGCLHVRKGAYPPPSDLGN